MFSQDDACLMQSASLTPLSRAINSALLLMGLSLSASVLLAQGVSAQEQGSATSATTTEEAAVSKVVSLPTLGIEVNAGRGAMMPVTPAAMEQSYGATAGGANVIKPPTSGSQSTLRDILGNQPGVTLLDFFGGNDHPAISIRGSGIQSQPMSRGVTLLVDGMPLNDADGSFHMGMLEPRNASMIGVRRGANALNPNAQTLGGEIDFLSHTGTTETGALSLQYGSDSTLANRFGIGRAFETWDFHVSGSDQRTDGFREHSRQRRQAFRANLGFYGSGWENRTWLSYTNQYFEIPGPLSRDAALGDSTYDGVTDKLPIKPLLTNPHRHTEGWRVANLTTLYSGPWVHSLGVYAQRADDIFQTPTQVWDTDLNTYGLQYIADTQFKLFNLGGALSYSRSDGELGVSGNPNQPMMPLRMMHHQNYDIEADNLVAQLHGAWQFAPNWTLSGQLRYVHTTRDVNGKMLGLSGQQSGSNSWDWLSPKLALAWEPNDHTMLFANVSSSREAPTLRDMVQFAGPVGAPILGPNGQPVARRGLTYVRDLEPQKNLSFEIGGRGLFNHQYGWDLTLYHADIEHELISYSPDGTNTFIYNYDDDTRHQGIELGVTGQWSLDSVGNLEARLAYTYNRFTFRDGIYAGNHIGGLPRQYISVNVDYSIADLVFGVNVRGAIGSSYADHANTQKMSGYAIWGAHISYEFAKESTVYLQVDNITDKRYISWTSTPNKASANQDIYFPGNGRTVTAGVNLRF